ncbi:MSHA biogenesis protein MshI [Aliivibrio sp. SR45-2]|uniref:MSHA biogenesis protein MshI n=1 Tax=Aliivibrio sp. SR45-2 TaxID=2760931 RepID=UPI0015FA82C7|nr:MSHA biogenesis protein MshI [Aliivibrio sp. SR45-2]MBB1313179.1 MSHA biogenesis protein MshI [Aliivibrio sp. SR45-2]
MNMMDAFKKLTLSRSIKTTTSIVLLQGGIYIAKSDDDNQLKESHYTEINHPQAWKEALVSACQQAGVSDCGANIIVGSHLYQSFQIEKPNIPKEELIGALPFLVKDLITDRVSDIVADGIETSNGKLQVYISQIATIKSIVDLLQSFSIQVINITPDELTWANAKPEQDGFMLLCHSKSADFKLLAFNEGRLHLNRSLRGIKAPLTGDESSHFQLDNLALELQRSLDYLSAHSQGVNINHLYFRCDDEDDSTLSTELQNRLGVKVASLIVDEPRVFRAGEVLSWLGLFNKPNINLYNDTLKPKTDYLTLPNVLISWGVGMVLVGIIAGYYQWQLYGVENKVALASSQESIYNQELIEVNKKLAGHKPSAAKLAAIKRLKDDINAKKASLKMIDNFDEGMQVGYSGLMSSLTQIGKGNISLTKIYISGNDVNFTGFARTPDVVPSWIQSFESELHLVGRTFAQLDIKTDEKGVVSFTLNTTVSKESNE